MPNIHKHRSSFVLMYDDFPTMCRFLAYAPAWAFFEYEIWQNPPFVSFSNDDEAYMLLLCMLDTIGPYDSDIPNETRD